MFPRMLALPLLLLLVVLSTGGKIKQLAAVCEERLQHKDTPYNRYLAARVHFELGQLDQAYRHIEASLRHEPDDLRNNLSMAALLLKRADMVLARTPGSPLSSDAFMLRACHAALVGDPDTARQILDRLTQTTNHELADRLLAVLGR
jgi:tetratricopeptide (TPR) repeat protein